MSLQHNEIVAFVTGANRGIGLAITRGLLQAGAAKVYTAVRNTQSVAPLVAEYGNRIVPVSYDLTQPDTLSAAAAIATDVNLVVSNAGVVSLSTPLEASAIDTLQSQMELNVYPLISLAQAFSDILKNNGGGAFVQMNSLASIKNFLPFTAYSASKSAAYSITQALRESWQEQGTQVISVVAGPIRTEMAESAGMAEGAPEPEVVAQGILSALDNNDFFVYPDPMAQEFASHYRPFAQAILEIDH